MPAYGEDVTAQSVQRTLLLACLWLLPAIAAIASVPAAPSPRPATDVPLSAFVHKEYTQDAGAPQSVGYLVQDHQGYLWLVATNTLYRFDGMRFEPFDSDQPLGAAVEGMRSIRADPKQGIWIGYTRGGVAHLVGDTVRMYGPDSGLPDNKQVLEVGADGQHAYAATPVGLFRLSGDRWTQFPPVPELRDQAVDAVHTDRQGRLWVKTATAVYYQPMPGAGFVRKALGGDDFVVGGLFNGPGDSVWSWSHTGDFNLCRVHPDPQPVCWKGDDVVRPTFDAYGDLWWSRTDRVFRVRNVANLNPKDPADLMRHAESLELSGGYLDITRDGSIWVYGSRGMHRLRRPLITRAETPSGGLAAGDGGDVWLVSYSRGLMRVGQAGQSRGPFLLGEDDTIWDASAARGASEEIYRPLQRAVIAEEPVVLERHFKPTTMRLDRDGNGDFYAGTLAPPGLVRLHAGQLDVIAAPSPLDRGVVLRGAKRDAAGHLWLGLSRNSVPIYQQRGAQWVAGGDRPIPAGITLNGFAFDRQDTLWIAAGTRGLIAVTAKQAREYAREQGADIGLAGDVYPFGDTLWAAGMRGVAVWDGKRFVTLRGRGGERFAGATGMAQEANGDIWLNGTEGITRIRRGEWQRALATPDYEVMFTRLDSWEGLNSPAAIGPFPAAARSTDGTLWFAMRAGLYRLDPRVIPEPLPPPPVVLGNLSVDGKSVSAEQQQNIAPGLHRLVLGLSAPAAERPERTRFRYRLTRNGDAGPWIYIGGDRQIVFDQMGYGRYRLELLATGRDGQWGDAPTALEFRVLPAFHQSAWFYALLALSVLALLAILYMLRVRSLHGRLRDEMNARLRERERIARDLHDTLLQGMQGLLLSFQGIASRLAPQDPLRERMEQVLDRTEDVIREGRDRVSVLRDPRASTLDLPDALQRHARDLAVEKKLLCDVSIPAPPRTLRPDAYEELLQIGREAIQNAFQHSQGTQVWVLLAYSDEGVLLKVQDNGVGLPADAGATAGHWGLKGMHERAQLIGALLHLQAHAPSGTEVKVFLPAAQAYPSTR